MARKSLEVALGDRFRAFSSSIPGDADAFANLLTMLLEPQIDDGHEALASAVSSAAKELGKENLYLVRRALDHIESEKSRVAAMQGGRSAPISAEG